MVATSEDALGDARVEFVQESTPGVPPSNPSWSKWSDAVAAHPGWDPDAGIESPVIVGEVDPPDHWRGNEEHALSIQYWAQRLPTDGNGTANDPSGDLITYDGGSMPSYTVVARQVSPTDGNDGAGYRDYTVALGARPVAWQSPGEPDTGTPITFQNDLVAERTRSYVIHQPSSSTTLDIVSTDSSDTMDITIESEGASTTSTKTLSGTTTVSTTSSFDDIDAAWLSAEPTGDITITDGSGTTLLTIYGSATDGVEGDRGVPILGTGSHATDIGSEYIQSIAVDSDYGSSDVADRVHGLDLTVEVDFAEDPTLDGTRRTSKDAGTRTAQCDADTAGEFNSHKQLVRYFTDTASDFDYIYNRNGVEVGRVVLNQARLTDADEKNFEAGEPAIQFSATYTAQGDPTSSTSAVTIN